MAFESFIRDVDLHRKFREDLFEHPVGLFDDLSAAFTAGDPSEQQEVFQGIKVGIMSDGITEIDTDRTVNGRCPCTNGLPIIL